MTTKPIDSWRRTQTLQWRRLCDHEMCRTGRCDWRATARYRLSLSVISDRSRNNTARVLFAWLMSTGSGCGWRNCERERERGRSFTMDRDRVLPNFILPPGIYRRASRAPLCDPLSADCWWPLSPRQICYTQSLHYERESTLQTTINKLDKLKDPGPTSGLNIFFKLFGVQLLMRKV